jgi:hypothetical protein
MRGDSPLDFLPLWSVLPVTAAFVLLSLEAGLRFGRWRHSRPDPEKEAPIGPMVGATLGLLAFLLAFTFSLTATRFDARRHLLIQEANAIGTAWLRAGLVAEQPREVIRRTLREYTDLRLEVARSGDLRHGLQRTDVLHRALWSEATAVSEADPRSIVAGLLVQSLNEVIDLHAERVAAVRARIPPVIWLALFGVTAMAMLVLGYNIGLSMTKRSTAALVVAVAFSSVIWLITDLDRAFEGSFRVSQQALSDTRRSMAD